MEFFFTEKLFEKIELKNVLVYSFSILLILLGIVSLPSQSYAESCVSRCISNNKNDLGSCLSDCSQLFKEDNLNSVQGENNLYYYEIPILTIITIILILALLGINILFVIKTLYYSNSKEEFEKVEIKGYDKIDS